MAAKDYGYDMKREHALQIRSMAAEFAIPKLEEIFGKGFPYHDIKKHRIELMEEYVNKNGVDKKKGADIVPQILRANGLKVAIATSSDSYRTNKYLSMAGIKFDFDVIVCGPEITHSKPAPDIYLTAARKLGVKPSECIALEDSPNGIMSAYNAGCLPIMIPDLDEPDENTKKNIHAKLDSLNELIEFLELKNTIC